ncbi:hypothetical protein F7R91_35230 [Streptomyces luteolifulvus]|uniref:Uncharacterized protein n=1 Tax=Streptomyces luteolifulvus TaxID=2615112 RepID=A0A6H9UQI7_9ACTN|nr:hypothetical protein [Streptomyces luteolifulvus]KAB1140704.1 hypothetical protein F7R91_35230 [Streptomyces luteolifulvus]
MTISSSPAATDKKLTAAYVLTVAASALTLLGLYVLDWFPDHVWGGQTFLEYRTEHLADRGDSGLQGWEYLGDTYFQFGYLVQTAAFVLLPFVVARYNRWHWLAALAVLGAAWQVAGMSAAAIVNTTFAPAMGPLAGILAVIGWVLARVAVNE